MKKILVVGSSNTDLIIKVPEIPRPGETLLGGEFMTFPGGKEPTRQLLLHVQEGMWFLLLPWEMIPMGLKPSKGINWTISIRKNIKICKGVPSGIAMITISEKGENAITVASGANADLLPG